MCDFSKAFVYMTYRKMYMHHAVVTYEMFVHDYDNIGRGPQPFMYVVSRISRQNGYHIRRYTGRTGYTRKKEREQTADAVGNGTTLPSQVRQRTGATPK